MTAAALIAALVLLANDVGGQVSVGMAAEYDTNATRIAVPKDERPPPGDALVRSDVVGHAVGILGDTQLTLDAVLGGKLFVNQASERMLIGQARTVVERPLMFGFRARASHFAKARAQRSLTRTWIVQRGDVVLERPLFLGLQMLVGAAGDAFISYDAPLFSSATGSALLGGAFLLTNKERIDGSVDVGTRAFPLLARDESFLPRVDVPIRTSLSMTSARAVYLSAAYVLMRNASNQRGESLTRHRVSALVGTRLPLDVLAVMQIALQLTNYDDGISLGQTLFLGDDDESQNMAELSLSKPWRFGLTFEARVAWYGNELARERVQFSRITSALGVRMAL